MEDVFGELAYALLSTRSAAANYQVAFSELKTRYPQWHGLAFAKPTNISAVIRRAGLANRKARALKAIARRVFVEESRVDLEFLRNSSTSDAYGYLRALPEVGPKVAKCVLLYALQRPVLPLDVHNRRVLERLGIAQPGEDTDRVEQRVPAAIRFDLHVNLIAHGRNVCGPKPRCASCSLADLCPASAR